MKSVDTLCALCELLKEVTYQSGSNNKNTLMDQMFTLKLSNGSFRNTTLEAQLQVHVVQYIVAV